jgi:NDP-sugar pyrophosphorylase family protein
MLALLDEKLNPKVEKFSDYWMDIGRPDDYMKAIEDFESMKSKLLPNE